MASYTGNLPTFMGLNSWIDKHTGLKITNHPTNPDDEWDVYLASNGPCKAACYRYSGSHNPWSIVFTSSTPNVSGYVWSSNQIGDKGKISVRLDAYDSEKQVYYNSERPYEFLPFYTGEPLIGLFSSLEEALGQATPTATTPYGGEPSTTGGAETGTHELIFDPIDFPDTPSISLSDGGFISIWVPQKVQLYNLAKFFWSKDILSGAWWKNLVSNPIDMIVGLQILPIPIDRQGINHTTLNLGVVDTGVDMDYIDDQFVEISCGSIDLSEYWDAYIDYEPYTKISVYLPFIGVKELNTNDIMDTTIELKYVIDIASGACVAMLKADDSVMYHFAGNCAATVPLTSLQMQEVVKNVTQTAIAVGVGIASIAATEGAAAPAVGSMISSGINTVTHGPSVARSGSIAGNSGFMSVQTPYLIISRPNLCMPAEQQKYTGFPAFIAEDLIDLTGYTEVDVAHLHVMGCTDDELAEIDELLKKGVIF